MLTRNSPAITPTSERPIFTFSELNIVFRLAGKTIFVKICRLDAPNVRAIFMLSASVARNPASISSTVTISEIASAIKMMAPVPAPTRMMITGPRAILGRLFSTTR